MQWDCRLQMFNDEGSVMGCGAAGYRNALHSFACGSLEASTSQTDGACTMERKGPAALKAELHGSTLLSMPFHRALPGRVL